MWYFIAGLSGATMGSFTSAMVYRLYHHLPIARARSMCTSCKAMLSWKELIPILSFCILRGKCAHCAHKISFRYVLIEIVSAALYMYALYRFFHLPQQSFLVLFRDWLIISIALFTFVYDALYMEVSPMVTVGGGVSIFLLSLISDFSFIHTGLYGIALGVGWFLIQYVVSRGKWIGGGDIMIGFFMGAALGLGGTIVALALAYLMGASYGIAAMLTRKHRSGDQIAFGTFLSVATIIALWFTPALSHWYLNLFS